LGTSRARLIWQLLVESLILAVVGGAFGVLVAIWTSKYIGSQLTRWSPDGIEIVLDLPVLLFALICSAGTGVFFGLAPAWLVSRTNMNEALKASNRGATATGSQNRLRHGLIIGEIAFALVLLTGAGMFISGLKRFIHQDPGWRVDGLLIGWLPQSGPKYATADQRRSFVERLEERLSRLPGVQQVAISSSIPVWSFGTTRWFLIEGKPPPPLGQEPLVFAESVSPAYFDTLGIQLRAGRLFNSMDSADDPNVVIINERMARTFWPDESPIGKRISGPDRDHPEWMKIVGVVNDVRFPANLNRPETLWQTYRPLAQEPRPALGIELRTIGEFRTVAADLCRAVAELDSDLPVNELEPARAMVDRILGHVTLAGVFLGLFAAVGLSLAALGIYGVISYFVTQRKSEIGIRMAVGAQMLDVIWLVLQKGLVLSALGVLFGLAGAYGIARLLAAAVPQVPVNDPKTFAAVILTLISVALLACWLPARRAAKIDPIEALRCE
jgi:putative ABC transport system permease protein